MKIRVHTVIAAVIGLLLVDAHTGFAQSTMEVPAPSTQQQYQPPAAPPAAQYAPDSDSTPIQILPPSIWPPRQQAQQAPVVIAPPPAPMSQSPPPSMMTAPAPQRNPVLPAVFRGCWQGQVNEVDSIQREPGAHKVGFWTPKTYRLCYRRVGDGPFRLTFTETGVEPNDKMINPQGRVVPVATDGRAYAMMLATLHFDEYSIDRDAPSMTFSVDESTNLDCKIQGDVMQISAHVFGTRDGAPWFRALWHAQFVQSPS
jgi:hypothetical protein